MHAFFITNNLQITDVSARRHGQMFSDMRLMCCTNSSGFRIVFHLVLKCEEKSLLNSKTLVQIKVACKMNKSSTMIFKFNEIFLCTVNIIFTVVGIFLNSLVIISLLNSQLRRKLCYFMILVLACFDLAVVVVFHPLITAAILLGSWMHRGCDELETARLWLAKLLAFSLTALLTMTVERYLALVYPFFHQQFATRSRLIAVLLVFQLPFGILHSLWENDSSRYMSLATFTLYGAIFVAICGINLKLFCLAKKLRQRVHIPLGSLNGSEQGNAGPDTSKLTLASLRKISTCLLAVVCLFICYCPAFVVHGLQISKSKNIIESTCIDIIFLWVETIVTLNSSLNCLIFFYKNSVLRRHAINLLRRCILCGKARLQ